MIFYDKILFSSFLDDGETLLYTMHRHWITVAQKMLQIGLFGMLLPATLVLFFFDFQSTAAYVMYGWIALGFMANLYAFTDWYADAWLLTDHSIIDVKWDGFFKKSAQRLGYESIESVIYEINGVKGTILNFGTLTLFRESGETLELNHISKPRKAEARLSAIQDRVNKQSSANNLETLKDLLADVIEEKINNRGKGR